MLMQSQKMMSFNRNNEDFYYPNPETKSLEKIYVMSSDKIIRNHVSVELPEFNRLVGIGFNNVRYNLMAASIAICRTKPSNNYTIPEPTMFLSDAELENFQILLLFLKLELIRFIMNKGGFLL